MAKINVCDLCMKEGKLIETHRHMHIKGVSASRIDVCPTCMPKLPKNNIEYIKLCYSLHGVVLNDEEAKKYLEW